MDRQWKELFTLIGHEGLVMGCAVSADERVIVSASEDKTLKVWIFESQQEHQ